LEGHDDVLKDAAFSPDGRLVATASNDKTARLWLLLSEGEECDWSGGEPTLPPRAIPSVRFAGNGTAYAGDELWLAFTVGNTGRGDLVQLRAEVASDSPSLRSVGMTPLGRIKPGEKVERCLAVLLPPGARPGRVTGELVFHEANGYEPAPVPVAFTIEP